MSPASRCEFHTCIRTPIRRSPSEGKQPHGLADLICSSLGGRLIDRALPGTLREAAVERSADLQRLILKAINLSDLQLGSTGIFSPSIALLSEVDCQSVVAQMYLHSGLPWIIPITLSPWR